VAVHQAREGLELPSIYFAHEREVFAATGCSTRTAPFIELLPNEKPFREIVRFRTVGDMSCTGAVRSTANTIDEVIEEIASSRLTERGATRADDRFTEAAMEDRKREGYF
jgi:sulfate adenylyltransferase subunit 2